MSMSTPLRLQVADLPALVDRDPSLPVVPKIDADARVERVTMMAPALATIALGVLVLFCVGFLQTPAVHNGAHDTRHADGFPCH
jgi:cobalt transporter subunit CbtB